MIEKNKLDLIFNEVKKSGTKDSIRQMIYVVEELGEVSECLRCIHGDYRKNNKNKEDLAEEIGDLLITIFLLTKFEGLNLKDIIIKSIDKQYDKWNKVIDKRIKNSINSAILDTCPMNKIDIRKDSGASFCENWRNSQCELAKDKEDKYICYFLKKKTEHKPKNK